MTTWLQKLKTELFSGWTPFEAFWLFLFLAAQIGAYIYAPDSVLGMISGISGILCVVFVGKGKISNYLFGLIFAYTYFYISLSQGFYGEMTTTLYVYIPAQFIGYFLWKANMQKATGTELIQARALSVVGWLTTLAIIVVGSAVFISILRYYGGNSTSLDGISTVIVVVAQVLMILRYREQWILWIALNIVSIMLWITAEEPGGLSIVMMYVAYLLNSLYGYYNWTKLSKSSQLA
ncbi:nicotinamide riboside transporter PnuC [Pasteurellaceae bacterium 20609_3]|uniref:nicotinamide riboside transporter PnuC n=1 Tax=Spirabiliibacterium mucosae TaxID=28156 RepID=UPI001AACFD85|nr:nicotinamide riboside transporter PnuC [Spirabiliibacterium mucosae]MBE2898832.1 nicotinamide riboside transporter PnuC [Spirabiliibacterium mucosae]